MGDLILRGPQSTLKKVDQGVGEFFFGQAIKFGNRIFQIDGDTGKSETYEKVKQRSTKVAQYLTGHGFEQKDIIMLCCKNTLDNIIPALASLFLGAYVASVDPKQSVSDIRYSLTLIEPKAIFVEADSIKLMERSLEGLKIKPQIIVIGYSNRYSYLEEIERNTEEDKKFKPLKQTGSDIALILFSSGTTSEPKGIYITNNTIINGSMHVVECKKAKPGVCLHFSSLYWSLGWIISGICMNTGTAKVVSPNITAETFLQMVDKYKITFAITSNTFTYELSELAEDKIQNFDGSSLYSVAICGSTLDPQQLLKIRQLFPKTKWSLGYGSTELGFVSAHDLTKEKAYLKKLNSSGTPCAEIKVKIVDVNTGELLSSNQKGEIRLKSPYVMVGYHNLHKPDTFDDFGYLKIGDLGYYDDDGYLYITDRISETFKYRMTHISPTILENVLMNHPAVAEAVVIGIPHPVDRNHAGACVVLKKHFKATAEEIVNFANSLVSDAYKIRAGLKIIDQIKKTPSGKVQRREMKYLFN